MKKINLLGFYALLLTFAACSGSNNAKEEHSDIMADLVEVGYADNIKSIKVQHYEVEKEFDQVVPGKELHFVISYDGLYNYFYSIPRYDFYYFVDKIDNPRNYASTKKEENVWETYYFNDYGEKYVKMIEKYVDKRLISKTFYDASGDESFNVMYNYDDEGRLKFTESYYPDSYYDEEEAVRANFIYEKGELKYVDFIESSTILGHIAYMRNGKGQVTKFISHEQDRSTIDSVREGDITHIAYEDNRISAVTMQRRGFNQYRNKWYPQELRFKYNDEGLLSEVMRVDLKDKDSPEAPNVEEGGGYVNRFEYEFDDQDNWIRKVIYVGEVFADGEEELEPRLIVVREIIYEE